MEGIDSTRTIQIFPQTRRGGFPYTLTHFLRPSISSTSISESDQSESDFGLEWITLGDAIRNLDKNSCECLDSSHPRSGPSGPSGPSPRSGPSGPSPRYSPVFHSPMSIPPSPRSNNIPPSENVPDTNVNKLIGKISQNIQSLFFSSVKILLSIGSK